jgi:hypothetical protein
MNTLYLQQKGTGTHVSIPRTATHPRIGGSSFSGRRDGASAGLLWTTRLCDPYHDEGFAILERDGIALQFNVSDPTHEPPQEGCRVCYIGVTNIEALYQQYLPTGALRSPIQATDWGTKGFWLCDPFRNILIFEESIPEKESDPPQGV